MSIRRRSRSAEGTRAIGYCTLRLRGCDCGSCTSLIVIERLSKVYAVATQRNPRVAWRLVARAHGEFVAIMGASGSGKSTS